MRTQTIFVWLLATVLRAQPFLPVGVISPPPSHMDWVMYSLQNSARVPYSNERPTGESVSAARLRHKAPGKAVHAFVRGFQLAMAGSEKAAAQEFQSAVAIDPQFSEAHGDLGVEDTVLGLYDEATTEFRKAIELDPATAAHHANLAYLLIRMKRHSDAEPEAQTAVSLDPTNAKAQFLLGFLLARRPESRGRAIAHLEYAAREMPAAHEILEQVRHQP
jgi:Flp pilus assembly protein TadD